MWGRRQGRLGYGVNPVEMQQQQLASLRSLFVVRRVHLAGSRRIAHVETVLVGYFFRCSSSVMLHFPPETSPDTLSHQSGKEDVLKALSHEKTGSAKKTLFFKKKKEQIMLHALKLVCNLS